VFPFDVSTASFSELANSKTDNEVGTDFDYIDNLTIKKGRHTFKMGATFERIRLNQGITADPNLVFTDNNSLINDQLSSFAVRTTWWSRGYRRFYFLPYFADEMKLRSNLTLTLGLRWEYYSVMKEVKDRLTVFDLTGCGGVCPAGSPTEFPNYTNFDPRIGLAWAPAMFHNKTVIRAGYGIYSGPGQNDDTNAAFESNDFRIHATGLSSRTSLSPLIPSCPWQM
jgi:outer membrane receptor protein involved in Fe transport